MIASEARSLVILPARKIKQQDAMTLYDILRDTSSTGDFAQPGDSAFGTVEPSV